MNNREIKAMMAELAPVIREFTEAALSPIQARMEALERRFDDLPVPQDGKDADIGEIRRIITDEMRAVKEMVEALPAPEPLPDISGLIAEGIQTAVADLPAPQDGKSVTIEDVAPLIACEVEKRVSELPKPKDWQPGKDGKDVDPAELQRMVSEAAEKVVSAISVPKDGTDGAPSSTVPGSWW